MWESKSSPIFSFIKGPKQGLFFVPPGKVESLRRRGKGVDELTGFISVILSRCAVADAWAAKDLLRENRGFEFKGLRTGDASARNGPQHDV